MTPLAERDGGLWLEEASLTEIAGRYGTPCFVYSRAALESAYRAFDASFAGLEHLTCYALKSNSNLGVLDVFARLGSGFDVVSGGELARVVAAGGDPAKVVFSGVGKSDDELRQALALGIRCFNVESASELEHLERLAGALGRRAPVSLRINPDVDPQTHPYIATGLKESKFGIAFADAPTLYRRAAHLPHIAVAGIDIHIGSQITALEPYREAAGKLLELVDTLAGEGIRLQHVDLGGGIGIRYRDETPLDLGEYAAMVKALFRGRGETLVFEPGRRLTGNAGLLLTRVVYLKPGAERSFAVVDAAMNDLLRPALYDAWHAVRPVRPRPQRGQLWQIVGPVCESADFLARDRELALQEGDLLAILSAGAYAMAMSSNYNTRPRAAEVMVDGAATHLVGRRESIPELFARESRLP
ncbi:MAG TPA: diaminopimelate decarboxylase [Casimicrobiaceae bacterium]|nr:diaminopimelate decarboxylase [Casimicrobiaceae bacterium]